MVFPLPLQIEPQLSVRLFVPRSLQVCKCQTSSVNNGEIGEKFSLKSVEWLEAAEWADLRSLSLEPGSSRLLCSSPPSLSLCRPAIA